MKLHRSLPLVIVALSLASLSCQHSSEMASDLAERSFHFEYQVTLSEFPAGARQARVWLPLPVSDETQEISELQVSAPVATQMGTDSVFGNHMVYLELEAPFPEKVPVSLSVNVHRKECRQVGDLPGTAGAEKLLQGDQLAPLSEEARKRASSATQGRLVSVEKARGIYDRVLADVDYDKSGQGWGQGNLQYVCDVGKGNCSDFHTLFIAMARTQSIPSVFEIGFPLPADKTEGTIGGYHCWAWFQNEDGSWRPVDASEADKDPSREEYFFGTICENRVAFSRGRDLQLVPAQSGPPVNFFIYPYTEVDGKVGGVKVEKTFEFKNL